MNPTCPPPFAAVTAIITRPRTMTVTERSVVRPRYALTRACHTGGKGRRPGRSPGRTVSEMSLRHLRDDSERAPRRLRELSEKVGPAGDSAASSGRLLAGRDHDAARGVLEDVVGRRAEDLAALGARGSEHDDLALAALGLL